MKERIMKDSAVDALRMFYLGMVAGSKVKDEIELDANNLGMFGDLSGIAISLAAGHDASKVMAMLSGHVGFTLASDEEIEDSVLSAIKTDAILRSIRAISSRVNNHGEGTLDGDSMRMLHKLLSEHLEQAE